MKKLALILFLLAAFAVFAAPGYTRSQLNVTASIGPVFSIVMDDPEAFSVVGPDRRLIASREVGKTVIKSNYSSWKIGVDSANKSGDAVGGLKLDDREVYIPYTFALMDGSAVVVARFNAQSIGQPVTSSDGKSLSLFLYFDHSDETIWPRGIYRDTLILSITTD